MLITLQTVIAGAMTRILAAFAASLFVASIPGLADSKRSCAGAPRYVLAYSIFRSSLRDCRTKSRSCRRSAMASRVKNPCLSAFLLPRGAPDPGAPPCMRQRFLPATAGDLQGLPERDFAPQRRLSSIGPVLRG